MLLLLEGVDGSGKSTLAEAIKTRLEEEHDQVTLVHLSAPASPSTAIDECIDPLAGYHPTDEEATGAYIYDRAHWGCPAYGPIYRPTLDDGGYGEMGRAGWAYTELFFESRGAVTALIDCDPAVAEKRCRDRGEDYIHYEDLPNLRNKYTLLFAESITGAVNRRLEEPVDTANLADELIELARTKARQFHALSSFSSYVGPRYPELLVVSPPMRDQRIDILADLIEEGRDWQSTGFVSSIPTPQLDQLMYTLGSPELML